MQNWTIASVCFKGPWMHDQPNQLVKPEGYDMTNPVIKSCC